MATQVGNGTQTAVISTEHSLYSTTTAGVYAITVDTSNMAVGDELEIYAKEKTLTGSTAAICYLDPCANVQIVKNRKSDWLDSVHSIEFFIKQTAGTGRNFDWSVRRLDTAMGTADLTSTAIDSIYDQSNAVETNITLRKVLRALTAFLVGKASGGGTTTVTFRNFNDSKNVITYTLSNTTDGNRSSVSTDLT